MTIIAFAAVFAAAGLVAQRGVGAAAVATVGVASGSLGWWIVLTVGTALARHTAGNRLLTWVNRLSGVMIAGFGIATLVTGIAGFPG